MHENLAPKIAIQAGHLASLSNHERWSSERTFLQIVFNLAATKLFRSFDKKKIILPKEFKRFGLVFNMHVHVYFKNSINRRPTSVTSENRLKFSPVWIPVPIYPHPLTFVPQVLRHQNVTTMFRWPNAR